MIIKQTSKYKNNKPFCSGDVEPEHKFLITAPTSQHTGYFRLHRLRLHNNAYLTFYNLTLVVMVWLETVNRLLRLQVFKKREVLMWYQHNHCAIPIHNLHTPTTFWIFSLDEQRKFFTLQYVLYKTNADLYRRLYINWLYLLRTVH